MTIAGSIIHPTTLIEHGARIGENVRIGPFCHIGPETVIADGVEIVSHVVVTGRSEIGAGTRLFPGAVIGCEPQNVHYNGAPTRLVIGERCTIREGVTIHTGMPDSGGITRVGNDCLLLAYCHIAHDCQVGNNVIISNNVMLGGHVTIGDRVIIGGGAAVHQFARIGQQAFIGGLTGVSNDVIPYGMLNGNPGLLVGLNVIGMARAGMEKEEIRLVRNAYKAIFQAGGSIRDNTMTMKAAGVAHPAIGEIVEFILTDSERSLSSPVPPARPRHS